MNEVTIRDPRNHGGEAMTVTRDGRPVAELRPLARRPSQASLLLRRWRHLPAVDRAKVRADLDDLLDPGL